MNLLINFKKDDVLLVADYGRSAQGWLSFILCYILNARYIEPYDLLTGRKYTSSDVIENNTKGRLKNRETSHYAIVVKTHSYPAKEINLTTSIIYLTRDPRDVAISYYYMARNLRKNGTANIRNFLHIVPIFSYIITAFRWKMHFRSWQNIPSFRLRYEDLRTDTFRVISSVLSNFKVNIDQDIVLEAINIFSFENCYGRKRGTEDKNNSEARKGQIGDYRNYFTKLHNIIFWTICGQEAELAGYRFNGSSTIEPKN